MNYPQLSLYISLGKAVSIYWERSGGVVVRALSSHQCVRASISRLGVICGLSLLALFCALRDFPLGTLVLPSPQKPAFD